MYAGNQNLLHLFVALLLDLLAAMFLYQVFKINKKIKVLKKDKL